MLDAAVAAVDVVFAFDLAADTVIILMIMCSTSLLHCVRLMLMIAVISKLLEHASWLGGSVRASPCVTGPWCGAFPNVALRPTNGRAGRA